VIVVVGRLGLRGQSRRREEFQRRLAVGGAKPGSELLEDVVVPPVRVRGTRESPILVFCSPFWGTSAGRREMEGPPRGSSKLLVALELSVAVLWTGARLSLLPVAAWAGVGFRMDSLDVGLEWGRSF
jgi:hypothetical protein